MRFLAQLTGLVVSISGAWMGLDAVTLAGAAVVLIEASIPEPGEHELPDLRQVYRLDP